MNIELVKTISELGVVEFMNVINKKTLENWPSP